VACLEVWVHGVSAGYYHRGGSLQAGVHRAAEQLKNGFSAGQWERVDLLGLFQGVLLPVGRALALLVLVPATAVAGVSQLAALVGGPPGLQGPLEGALAGAGADGWWYGWSWLAGMATAAEVAAGAASAGGEGAAGLAAGPTLAALLGTLVGKVVLFRAAFAACVLAALSRGLAGPLRGWFDGFHSSVRDERYLVGQRLHDLAD